MTATPNPKVLIVGTGSIGERHLRCFIATGAATVVFCEPNEDFRKRVAETYKVPGYASIEAALEAEQPDAAVICTPAQTHLPLSTPLVESGLPLLIEKPLALNSDEGTQFARVVAAHNTLVRVAYVLHCQPTLHDAHKILHSGQYGAIRHVVVQQGQHFPTFRPAYREIYYASHASGGGAIQDALTHMINAVEWIAGPIARLYCDAAHQVLEGVDVEDTVNLVACGKDGCRISISQNQFQAANETEFQFHCEGGSVRVRLHRREVATMALGETEWTCRSWPEVDRDALFIAQAREFLAACRGETCVLATLDEALQTLRVQEAALESTRTQREIQIP